MIIHSNTLVLSLFFGLAYSKLYVSQTSEVKEENESFSVLCRDVDTGSQVHWRGPKNRALGGKTIPQVRKTMYGSQLFFEHIRKDDEGVYICKSASKGESAKFELIVTTKVEFVDTPDAVTAKEGSEIFIKCDATGAQTMIFVNGEVTNDTRYQQVADGLYIRNVTVEDGQNEYVCQATNTLSGHLDNKRINLTVTHPPRPVSPIPEYSKAVVVYGYKDGPVNLTCEVIAEPPPTFRWFQKDERYKVIGQQVPGPSPTVSVLMLMMKDPKDFGEYKCQVKNSEGTLNIIYSVLEGSKPDPPNRVEIFDINSTAVFMTVDEPENVDPDNRTEMAPDGVRVEYRSLDDTAWNMQEFPLAEDKIYIAGNLSANTTYMLRVAIRNPAGLSDFTNITYITTSDAFKLVSCNILMLLMLYSVLLTRNI